MAPKHRRVSRIIVLDQSDCVLLFLTQSPKLATPTMRWLTPGGGVDGEETHHEGARRELFEETGLLVDLLHGPVAALSGRSVLASGDEQTTYAEFFVHRTERFEISRTNWLDYEHEDIKDVRWFTLDEVESGHFDISPPTLAEIIRSQRA